MFDFLLEVTERMWLLVWPVCWVQATEGSSPILFLDFVFCLPFLLSEAARRHSSELVMWWWNYLAGYVTESGLGLNINFQDCGRLACRSSCLATTQDKSHKFSCILNLPATNLECLLPSLVPSFPLCPGASFRSDLGSSYGGCKLTLF